MGLGTFVSCDDDDLPKADALFRPIINEDDNIEHGLDANNSPYMTIKWDKYTSADQYIVKIEANDGSDTREITTDTTICRFDNLQYDKEYNISISSSSTKTGLSSKAFTMTTTTLDFPTSLITPKKSLAIWHQEQPIGLRLISMMLIKVRSALRLWLLRATTARLLTSAH